MILISFFILITPVFDSFLAASDLSFPLNLFRITPLVLASVAAYDSKKFFIPIIISALFFAVLSYPSDMPALAIALTIPLLFRFKYHFYFFSEQWIRPIILALGFFVGYLIWVINNISWSIVDYKYFGIAFLIQVIGSIVIAFIVLKIIDFFTASYSRYEIPTNRI